MLRNRVECVFSVYIKTNCYHLSCICRLCVNMEKSRDVIGVLTQLGKGWFARELAQ